MNNILRKLSASKGMTAVRKKDTQDPFTLWELNIAHVAPLIVNEATMMTMRYYKELRAEDAERYALNMDTLDYITKFYLAYHSLAVLDRKDALAGFAKLYTYLDTDIAREVYAYFTASFMQSVFCYIYTSAAMGIGLPRGLGKEAAELTDTYAIMSNLSDETRRLVYQELSDQGHLPGSSNLESLKKRVPDFTSIIVGEQEKQKQDIQDKKKKKKGASDEAG